MNYVDIPLECIAMASTFGKYPICLRGNGGTLVKPDIVIAA